ncbi:Glutathione S-transferase F13 [Vitis vinifera]|uniref:glutathione transferase n=1 Tax=Vitis vinifera TaxID=29760 RepID=A0A438IXD5_VITVI|nr:Glutathione S-transferase F13 [Vitis vinifera]
MTVKNFFPEHRDFEKLGKVLDVYEARLSTTKCLAEDFYNLVDHHHLSYTYYFMKTPWASLINSRPKVKAWWEDISSRPAFKKVVKGMTLVRSDRFLSNVALCYGVILIVVLVAS